MSRQKNGQLNNSINVRYLASNDDRKMIKRVAKPCIICGENRYLFSRGRCQPCARKQDSKPIISNPRKKPAFTPAASAELKRWFEDRRAEMTGICKHCGGRSSAASDQYYKCSIAHILPKNHFKSVATHPLNWIELCFWENDCHKNFDTFMLDITDLNCYDEVIEKFIAMYPDIDPKERRFIPRQLLDYVPIDI